MDDLLCFCFVALVGINQTSAYFAENIDLSCVIVSYVEPISA